MELETVRTATGRLATRAKAWRVCDTGVTYGPPWLRPASPRDEADAGRPARHAPPSPLPPEGTDGLDAAVWRVLHDADEWLSAQGVRARLRGQHGRPDVLQALERLTARGLVEPRQKNAGRGCTVWLYALARCRCTEAPA